MHKIISYGDDALIAYLGDARNEATYARLHGVMDALFSQEIWDDILPGYDSVTVRFDPQKLSYQTAKEHFKQALSAKPKADTPSDIFDLPVCYEGEHALDLSLAAKTLGISEDELMFHHSDPIYNVVFQGFIPGFTFCSGVDEAILLPRHNTPRVKVPAGSVGIANWQTGIYALPSPGGWQVLGATPLTLFDPNRDQPFLLCAGQRIKFTPISAREFDRIKAEQNP